MSYIIITSVVLLFSGEIPILQESSCGRFCDIRKRNCTMVSIFSGNFIRGGIQCGFEDMSTVSDIILDQHICEYKHRILYGYLYCYNRCYTGKHIASCLGVIVQLRHKV